MGLLSKKTKVTDVVESCDNAVEIYAAIAAALHAYNTDNSDHDVENTVLTINRTANCYSPWNSKFLSLRRVPR